jgi:hypothetical protein
MIDKYIEGLIICRDGEGEGCGSCTDGSCGDSSHDSDGPDHD